MNKFIVNDSVLYKKKVLNHINREKWKYRCFSSNYNTISSLIVMEEGIITSGEDPKDFFPGPAYLKKT